MFVQQFFVRGLSHLSYILAGEHNCAIMDPKRDVQEYLQAAKLMDLTITHVLETHLHADFVSGHLDLADLTGATIYAPKTANCRFGHVSVAEGDVITIDELEINVLDTAGHTPEHVSYTVTDHSRGKEPCTVFCGDTLFVGDVGRPDLFPGMAEELASKLYDNLRTKLLALPDFCEVYPAHAAGSLCGRAMSAKRSSTIGYERRYNRALQHKTPAEFAQSLLTGMPEAPDHFSRCSAINARGPVLVKNLAPPEPLEPRKFRSLASNGHIIADVRSYAAFGGAHIPNSYHIDLAGNFSTNSGWLLPPDRPVLLVGNNDMDIIDATTQLRRVGIDHITGYLDGGIHAWAIMGLPLAHVPHVSVHEFKSQLERKEEMVILDVRSQNEYDLGHINGAIHIHSPDLRSRYNELEREKPVVLLCNTAIRSSMASSILQQHGFTNLHVLTGGMSAWHAAGFITSCPRCPAPHLPRFPPVHPNLYVLEFHYGR